MASTSVVVTTYHSPGTLVLVLFALARQSPVPDEVVVADDGSSAETLEALKSCAADVPFRLQHVWQPDEAFRAARSRNNAIFRAVGDTVLFLDQDTLPHRDWMRTHLRHAREGVVGLGHLLELHGTYASGLGKESIRSGEFEDAHSPRAGARLAALHRKQALYALLRRCGLGLRGKPKLRSCNFSASRADLRMVNGFDEDYVGWGQEDDDLGRRLYAAGVQPVILVGNARVSHIPHAERREPRWKDGPNVRRYLRLHIPARCPHGLDAHPHPDVKVTVIH